jgi:hypothetical protein
MHSYVFLLDRRSIIILQVSALKNGIRRQMTLYFVIIVAGEQACTLRLSVHHLKSTIVLIVWQRLTYVKDR